VPTLQNPKTKSKKTSTSPEKHFSERSPYDPLNIAARRIQELTSKLDWGCPHPHEGHPIHYNTSDDIDAYLNGESYFPWLPKLTQKALRPHFKDANTLYFAGNGWVGARYTLSMSDIDVHKNGTPEEAKRFADRIGELFPNIFTETSTHGKGAHQYFLVDKLVNHRHAKDWQVNLALKTVDLWLKTIMYTGRYDRDMVEIKGTCPETRTDSFRIKSVKCGQLAKIPREIAGRFDEFQSTTVLTLDQIYELDFVTMVQDAGWDRGTVDKIRIANEGMSGLPCKPHLDALRDALKPLRLAWEQDDQPAAPVSIPFPVAAPEGATPRKRDKITPQKKVRAGSTDAPMVSDDLFHNKSIRRLINNNWNSKLVGAGRRRVNKEDLTATTAIYLHVGKHLNKDFSVPVSWAKMLWNDLIERGLIKRPFDPSRFASCRNFMTALGWIDWFDTSYIIGQEINGVHVSGQATKHGPSAYLMCVLDQEEKKEEERGDIDRNKIPVQRDIISFQLIESLNERSKRPVCRGWAGDIHRHRAC
jgi:hypothetical protein